MSLWAELYRPKVLDDCILPTEIKKSLSDILSKGTLPHLLFHSQKSGTGKTTCARAICNELGVEHILINGSEDSGIDTLRTKIRQFASTYSLSNEKKFKVVILDECDYLQSHSTQPALRSFMEEFAESCRFILTCNYKNRVIPALHSRCTCIDFNIDKRDTKLLRNFHKRLEMILNENDIKFDSKIAAELVVRFAPDWRRVLNECQRYSMSGELSPKVLSVLSDNSFNSLIKNLKEKDFKSMRKWCAENIDNDTSMIFRKIYDSLTSFVQPASVPVAVLSLSEYQYRSSFVADQEINLVACLTELMRDLTFK